MAGENGGGTFVGREAERALLNASLEAVAAGSPRIVSIEGAPGIGKTALLERFRAHQTTASIFAVTGEESEAALEFGILSQLLRDVETALPDALQPVVALRPEHGDPYMVGAGLVEALSDMQARGPVVLMVDDVQWADRSSLQALGFAFRRLEADRVLLVLSGRETFDSLPEGIRRLVSGDRGRRIVLQGLGLAEIIELAQLEGRPLRGRVAQRLHAATDGNPLFIRASLTELEAGVLEESWWGPLPAPRAYARAMQDRLDQRSPDCRDLVEAASVLGARCRTDELFQMTSTAPHLAALDEAIGAGMVTHHEALLGGEVRFAHPLIRAAVYHALPLQRKSALHARAAEVVTGEPLAIRHAAVAVRGPDPELAARLEQFAQGQMLTGSWVAAAQALVEAARLSADRDEREQRRLDAAECSLMAGDTAAATRLLADISADGSRRARHEYLSARLSVFAGRTHDADAQFQRAWERLEGGDDELAARIAGWYSLWLGETMRNEEAVEWSRRAVQYRGTSLLPLIARLGQLCIVLAIQGDAAGSREISAALPRRASEVRPDQLTLLVARGLAHSWGDQLDRARDDLATAADLARQRGDAQSLILAWGNLADVEYRLGDWDSAVMHGELAASAAEDSDHVLFASDSSAITAFAHAARGAWSEAERCVQAAERTAAATGPRTSAVEYAAVARARLELTRRRPELAAQALEPLVPIDEAALRNPGILPWRLLYAEALHDQGRHEAAAAALDEDERRIRELDLRSLLVVVGRLRGQFEASAGRPDQALAAFESGLRSVPPEMAPYEFARLEVAFGGFLRRQGRRRAAREQLESARARLTALRAEPELGRCEAELTGTGLRAVRRTVDGRNLLTSQELAVARLVATGLKTREVAGEMFLSERTIEYHLGNIYSKLGLRSRGQLVRYMLEPAAS